MRQYVPKEENIISDKQSGKNFDRPGYKSLRERVREGDELYVKSIYRLGRDKEAIKNELKFLKKKGVLVHILDFPQTMIEVENEYQLRVVELINTLMIEIFSFIAQEERENIRRRQAEGIAVWRKTGKTKTGRPYGRPKIQFPSNWKKMLVAHLDTVHEQPVKDICVSADRNILMSPQGIGGDDRCGVFALVKVYRLSKIKPWLLFCCDEEVGGLGAKKFSRAHQQHQLPKELDDLKFIIELDRKGSRDAVYYRCDNPDFEEYISGKGFQSAQGSFSDISLIAPELGIAAVNLSCGYYAAHTRHEYINRSQLADVIHNVVDIVADSSHADFPKFDYRESLMPIAAVPQIRRYDNLSTLDDAPHNLPANLRDIYKFLLDFYSANELESFRAEFGDQILCQIYNDEIAPLYYY